MADFSTLIASIEETIKTNGVQAITGQILQDEMLLMVSAINQLKQDTLEGYAFYGQVLADGGSASVTQNTFFLVTAGTYTINGNTFAVTGEGLSVVVYDSVNDEVRIEGHILNFDTAPTNGSTNPVTSGGAYTALAGKQALVPAATEGNLAEFDAAGQVKDAGKAIADLAPNKGVALDLLAGFTPNLVDTRSAGTPQGPYAFRQSGGDGVDYLKSIKGRTLVWNQLVQNGDFADGTTRWGASGFYPSVYSASGGVLTLTPADTSTTKSSVSVAQTLANSIIAGHTYLVKIEAKVSESTKSLSGRFAGVQNDTISFTQNTVSTSWATFTATITASYANTRLMLFFTGAVDNATADLKNVMLIDLTLLGWVPSTAEEFRAVYPLSYYAYTPALMKNNAATDLESTGFNQWDEEWDLGYWDASGWHANSNFLGCKNRLPVLPNTAYYWKCPTNVREIEYWNAANNYLGRTSLGEGIANTTFTTPADCTSITFYFGGSYGSVYNHDICINISDPSRNGTYEPYWKREIVLGLNSIPCHDENNNAVVVNGLDGVGTSQDELIVENGWGTKIIKRRGRRAYQAGDESDATLMTDGTNTDYPLATPKVLTLDNPIPALIEVDNLGTEKRLPEDTADNPQGPFESDSNYSVSVANLVRKLSE